MLEVFNYLTRLKTESFSCGVDREMVLFIEMVNEKEHIIEINDKDFLKENKDIIRLIEFVVYCVSDKLYNYLTNNDYSGLNEYIIKALTMFKWYGNDKTNKEEFLKIMGAN